MNIGGGEKNRNNFDLVWEGHSQNIGSVEGRSDVVSAVVEILEGGSI